MDPTTVVETLHKEWPIIKQAPYSFGVSILVVSLVIWTVFEWRHRKMRGRLEGSNGGNSTANATGGSVNQYFAWPPHEAPKAELPPATDNMQRPEIVFLKSRVIGVHFGIGGGFSVYESAKGERPDATGVFACFRNNGGNSKTAYGVRASLKFVDNDGMEVGTGVSVPYWLAQSSGQKNLPPDASGCVLLLLKVGTEWSTPWAKKIMFRGRPGIQPSMETFRNYPSKVEIRLRDSENRLLLMEDVILEIQETESGVITATQLAEHK